MTQGLSLGSEGTVRLVQEGEPPVRPSGLEDLLHRLAEQAQLRGPDNEPVDLTAEQQEEQQRREHSLRAAVLALFPCKIRGKKYSFFLIVHLPPSFMYQCHQTVSRAGTVICVFCAFNQLPRQAALALCLAGICHDDCLDSCLCCRA